MIDIFELDADDRQAIGELVDLLRANCTDAQCQQFLADLHRWDRSIPKEVKPVVDAYTRMCRRGAFVPAIVRRYVNATEGLTESPAWQEILQWRAFISSLPATTRKVA